MQTVAFSLFLLVTVAMTVHAKDISDNLSLPPLKDHLYFFDIATEASPYAVKQALKNFTIDQSFKVIGENRLLMVIRSNTIAELRRLRFPKGSKVKQYPVENIAEYLSVFGAGAGWKDYTTLKPKWTSVLTLVEKKMLLPKTMCMPTLELEIQAWAKMVEKYHDLLKPLSYPLLANYPPKVVFIVDVNEQLLQKLLKGTTGVTCGPGRTEIIVKRIVRV